MANDQVDPADVEGHIASLPNSPFQTDWTRIRTVSEFSAMGSPTTSWRNQNPAGGQVHARPVRRVDRNRL
jgi:hypothetical protein